MQHLELVSCIYTQFTPNIEVFCFFSAYTHSLCLLSSSLHMLQRSFSGKKSLVALGSNYQASFPDHWPTCHCFSMQYIPLYKRTFLGSEQSLSCHCFFFLQGHSILLAFRCDLLSYFCIYMYVCNSSTEDMFTHGINLQVCLAGISFTLHVLKKLQMLNVHTSCVECWCINMYRIYSCNECTSFYQSLQKCGGWIYLQGFTFWLPK